MKNIAIVIDGLTGGGAEKVMISLATEIVKQGHRVTILSLNNRRDYYIPDEIKVCCLFEHKATKVDRFWQIKSSLAKLERWFKNEQEQHGTFNLVLSNLDRSNNLLAQSNVKSVYYILHSSVEEELKRQKKLGPLTYLYLLNSKRRLSGKNLITVSKGIEQEIKEGVLVNPKSIQTIYNPFDFDDIGQKSVLPDSNIPNEPFIIHVGRLAKAKRHDILFSALRDVDPKIKLVLLCNKPQKALKLAAKFGVEDRLILPGFQSNPYNWISHAKALVLSSDYEGLPTVLVEAIAVGTTVVSTACPHGPEEILTGELTKFLVPRRESKALAEAIESALVDDVELSKVEILEKVSAKQIAQQYLALAK